MLCLAYGAGPILFAEFLEKDSIEYFPGYRVRNCKREYEPVTFAFNGPILRRRRVSGATSIRIRLGYPLLKSCHKRIVGYDYRQLTGD